MCRISEKHQPEFSEVKSSQAHFWKPTSFFQQLLVRVVNDLLIRSVSQFSTKYQFSEVKSSRAHFWKPPSFSAVTRARSKIEWVPSLANCADIPSRPQGVAEKAFYARVSHALVRKFEVSFIPKCSISWTKIPFFYSKPDSCFFTYHYLSIISKLVPQQQRKREENVNLYDFQRCLTPTENLLRVNVCMCVCESVLKMCCICG